MSYSMKISGLTIVRNAISNGYLIAEVIDTLASISDEVIVCDGYSDDGTYEYLQTRDDIQLFQDDWNLASVNGLEFAKITNQGMARCTGDYIFYLQADEIIHEDQLPQLEELIRCGKFNSIICNFHHIRYDLEHCLREGYASAARVVRNKGTYSKDDGYDFGGEVGPAHKSKINIYHYGYVFLENILRKMINHSDNFYTGAPNYANRKKISEACLERIEAGETLDPLGLQKALEPEYTLKEHQLPMPRCIRRLRGATKYTLPEPTKRYYWDLDETLCLTPASRDYSKAVPIWKMIAEVNRLYDESNEITIYTARGGTSGIDYHDLTTSQLTEWGVKYDALIDKGKPPYDVLVDDKAIHPSQWCTANDISVVGMVASAFDLLHPGHVLYLEEARSKCDKLVACLHRDPSIERSEKNKPVQTVEERRIQLRVYVDEIIEYDTEAELTAICDKVRPAIRFIGSDNEQPVTGRDFCGTVYVHDRTKHNYSSSDLRQRIKDAEREDPGASGQTGNLPT